MMPTLVVPMSNVNKLTDIELFSHVVMILPSVSVYSARPWPPIAKI